MKNVFLTILFVFFVSCTNDASKALNVEKDKTYFAASEVAVETPVEALEVPEEASSVSTSVDMEKPIEAKIIRTSNLRFETANLSETYTNIRKAVMQYKGSIQNDESGKNYNASYRNIIIRIPNDVFIAFLDEISKGVNHFDRKEISSQDITEEYIDVEARMNAKKNLEKRYLQLLTKAMKVSEIIEIEKQLAAVREEIEAKEGQLRYMKNKISMSTVTVEMYTNDASESGATASFGGKIWNAIKTGFNGLSRLLIGIISLWPFVILLILIFIFIKRKLKKKTT
jgi:Domain of unknown function (DUF4349)